MSKQDRLKEAFDNLYNSLITIEAIITSPDSNRTFLDRLHQIDKIRAHANNVNNLNNIMVSNLTVDLITEEMFSKNEMI
jgi:hypothetical protein